MECSKRTYKLAREDIAYVKFILEGHEGLSIMTTLDPHEAVILLYIAPGAEEEISLILDQISQEIPLEPISYPLNDIYSEPDDDGG